MDNWILSLILGILTVAGSAVVAWLTSRGARSVAKEQALATKDATETQDINARIRLLLDSYDTDREADDRKIKSLEEKVTAQGAEIQELKARFPRYRKEIRRLRYALLQLGHDPGPWPDDLE